MYRNPPQFKIPGCTVVIKLADDSAIENEFLYNNDWELVSFGERDGDDLLRRKNSVKIIRGTRLIHNRVDE